MSSPGAGKTALLEATIDALKDEFSIAVIEGDLETENDAARVRAKGVPAIQITTRDSVAGGPTWTGHHFGYGAGNPVNLRDPSGTCPIFDSVCDWWDEHNIVEGLACVANIAACYAMRAVTEAVIEETEAWFPTEWG